MRCKGDWMEYWHNLITEKSWNVLQQIKKEFDFILIGGWAVYLYTKALKSKDVDIVVNFETLNEIRKNHYLNKNDKLKKYEIKIDEIDVDIYVKNYSILPIPLDEIEKNVAQIEGFKLVKPEILLILKQTAEINRGNSEKGMKDKIDIINLLIKADIDFDFYHELIKKYNLENYRNELIRIIKNLNLLENLNLNVKQYKPIKLKLLKELK